MHTDRFGSAAYCSPDLSRTGMCAIPLVCFIGGVLYVPLRACSMRETPLV